MPRADFQQLEEEVQQLRVRLRAANIAHSAKERSLAGQLDAALLRASDLDSQLDELRTSKETVCVR